jgi:hypothetical protein
MIPPKSIDGFVLSSPTQEGGTWTGMNENPDVKSNPAVKRMWQRSLFPRVLHSLELPIDKQYELHTAIAELLLTALTLEPVKEINIDDDEQQAYT